MVADSLTILEGNVESFNQFAVMIQRFRRINDTIDMILIRHAEALFRRHIRIENNSAGCYLTSAGPNMVFYQPNR
ncbi:hypothetical protein SDC9_168438 [bioreactor metagenome]|uniref:Uncharacterized protein n=1 Tax=bioreactor metagenome TaxID=1076179 RepID=A0A645G5I2_9ZZZZ